MTVWHIVAVLLAVGLLALFVWQLIKLIKDIKKYRKMKKEKEMNNEVNGNDDLINHR